MAAQPPRPKMPPLTALRAFEAAGRLGGFTPAALELGVTPGAVTAHLKTLETTLGVALFDRHARGVSLTDLGARVLPEFTAAFAALNAAVHGLQVEAAPGLVRIAATPDWAQLWLSPRLPALRRDGLRVALVPVTNDAAARGVADLLVSVGAGDSAPLVAVVAPGAATDFAGDGLDPARCLTLQGPLGDWARWGQAAGLSGFTPRGAVFGQAALAVEEAVNGAGVLVIARPLVDAALSAGRLVLASGVVAHSGYGLDLRVLRDGDAVRAVRQALQGRATGLGE